MINTMFRNFSWVENPLNLVEMSQSHQGLSPLLAPGEKYDRTSNATEGMVFVFS